MNIKVKNEAVTTYVEECKKLQEKFIKLKDTVNTEEEINKLNQQFMEEYIKLKEKYGITR